MCSLRRALLLCARAVRAPSKPLIIHPCARQTMLTAEQRSPPPRWQQTVPCHHRPDRPLQPAYSIMEMCWGINAYLHMYVWTGMARYCLCFGIPVRTAALYLLPSLSCPPPAAEHKPRLGDRPLSRPTKKKRVSLEVGGCLESPLSFSCDIFSTNADITTKLVVPSLAIFIHIMLKF